MYEMTDLSFSFLDLETTGFHPSIAEIIEVCIAPEGDEIFHHLVKPYGPIPREITALTGISKSMVSNKPFIDELVEQIQEKLVGKIVVAHNASFDLGFIEAELSRIVKSEISLEYFCTLYASRKIFSAPSYNLGKLTKSLGYKGEAIHRAKDDVAALKFLFSRIQKKLYSEGSWDYKKLRKSGFIKDYRISPKTSSELRARNNSNSFINLETKTKVSPRLVSFNYNSQQSQTRIRTVEISEIGVKEGNIYLVGRCVESNNIKHFRWDRIVGQVKDFHTGEIITQGFIENLAGEKIPNRKLNSRKIAKKAPKTSINKPFRGNSSSQSPLSRMVQSKSKMEVLIQEVEKFVHCYIQRREIEQSAIEWFLRQKKVTEKMNEANLSASDLKELISKAAKKIFADGNN